MSTNTLLAVIFVEKWFCIDTIIWKVLYCYICYMKNIVKIWFFSLFLLWFGVITPYTYADSGDNSGVDTWSVLTGWTTGETWWAVTTYTVNYYKHNLWNALYSLESTATFTGEVDWEVAVSDLVKFITWYTFEVGYLNTWDTTRPTEWTVTTMTISADVSNVINMYYRPNRLYVQYDVNWGNVKKANGYSQSGSLVTWNSSTKILRWVYGSNVWSVSMSNYKVEAWLHDYNNSRSIYITKVWYVAKSNAQWNSRPDGKWSGYDQRNEKYRAQWFVWADMTTGDAVVTVYVNWVPSTYTVAYNLNGWTYWTRHPTTAIYDTGFMVDNPTRELSTFLWWKITGMDGVMHTYGTQTTTATTITGTKEMNYMNLCSTAGTVTFTAQWQCPNGYSDSGTWCTLDIYTIAYNLNGWAESQQNPATYTIESGGIVLNNPSKTWYTFLWRSGTDIDWLSTWVVITWDSIGNRVFEAVWQINSYTITYDIDWSNKIIVTWDYNTGVVQPQDPVRNWYKFLGWSMEIPEKMPAENIVITAKWERLGSSWYGSRWSSNSNNDSDDWKDKINENKKSDDNSKSDDTWNQGKNSVSGTGENSEQSDWKIDMDDLMNVYLWARDNWITTWETLEAALPDGYIERWEMAKLVVNFVNDVLWREVPKNIPSKCSRWDKETEWESAEEKKYAEQSCALWLMWIYMQNFKPNKLLDRAEFGTIVSRILWWEKFNVPNATTENKYYVKHLNEVKKENLITQIENPETIKELRKWIWIVLKKIKK